MKDRDAFALGAAVDNLIKITAGENGCRYSHALTACNMLPVSMGASCQDIFISKIQMPDRDNRNADFYFPNSVPNSDRVERKIYLSRRKSQRHNKLSKEFRKRFARRRRKKLGRDLTLSPRCIPTFAAGPSGRVHITYANVRPSVPVLPPTTLRPKPAAVKLNKLSI